MYTHRFVKQRFDLRRVAGKLCKDADQVQEGGELTRSDVVSTSIGNIGHKYENQVQYIIDVDKVPPLLSGAPYFKGILFPGCPGSNGRNGICEILILPVTGKGPDTDH